MSFLGQKHGFFYAFFYANGSTSLRLNAALFRVGFLMFTLILMLFTSQNCYSQKCLR